MLFCSLCMFPYDISPVVSKLAQRSTLQRRENHNFKERRKRPMGESSNDNRRHKKEVELGTLHRIPREHERPYWQRAHRDWRFWTGVIFIFAALFIFIMSDNLAFIPRH